MFKKAASLLAACALCIGLAIPAFAAETYAPYTVTANDATVTFDAVSISKTTIKLGSMEGDPVESEVTMITAKPGSNVTVKDNAGYGFVAPYGYVLGDDGVYNLTMASYELETGVIDKAFMGKANLIFAMSENVYLELGTGGTT